MFKSAKWIQVAGLVAGLAVTPAIVYSMPPFTPGDQPYAYAPPLGIGGFNLSTGTQVSYQTWFDPNDWYGDLVAFPVSKDGSVDLTSRLWSASNQVELQNYNTGRKIVTRNSSGTNVAFRWTAVSGGTTISSSQKDSINTSSTTGEKILNFVRGDRTNEKQYLDNLGNVLTGSASGIFRARFNVLGDIIHGRPIVVGAPTANYDVFDATYAAFKSTNATRASIVYAGANDGMLHAFSAATGDELFAYIPSMLIGTTSNQSPLTKLSVSPYVHTYFVDGGLAVGDVTISGAWKTVLVGGLGAGGKGLFALDVTSGSTPATEEAAKDKILWEITTTSHSSAYADLGNTYGDPLIVRLNTGVWAAIVGNGYNNTGNEDSILYLINIADGSLIKKINVGSGSSSNPAGLSTPIAIDTNSDNKIDFVYAGDIDGKMWKFDLRDASNPNNWTSTLVYNADPAATGKVSIIGAPDVASHPLGGFMVYFGTGRLFTTTQATDTTAQNYAYGIWDGAPAANTALLDQTLTSQAYGSQQVRVSSAKQINWAGGTPVHKGWRTALPAGEHFVTAGYVRDGRYQFTSVNPSIVNSSLPNGANWLVELDYLNGGTDGKVIFDLNADTNFSDADRVAGTGTPEVPNGNTVPVGIYLGAGLFSQPLLALVSSTLSTTLFNSNPFVSPGGTPGVPPPPATNDAGIAGGHFDLDVFHGINMSQFKHTHKYDDVYDVVGANLENASDSTYNLVNTSISGNRVTSSSRFFVLVSNGDLSPGVTVTVGGVDYKAYQYPNTIVSPTIYTPATANVFQFKMPVDAFAAKDWGTGVVRAGLLPTGPECVMSPAGSGSGRNGALGEISDGALTIWIVKEGAPASAIALNVAGMPEKGYKVITDSWVLKKYAVYWHNGVSGTGTAPCYGTSGWNQAPGLDTPESVTARTPAAGSADPKGVPGATVVSTNSVNTTTGSGRNARTTTTTTTNYSDGSRVVVITVRDSRGRIVGTPTTTYFPPTVVTPPGGAPPKVTTGSPPPPRTGYNQSRKSGKTGRVAWHEIIKE